MSISNSLSNAVSGMTAAARMAEIVSSNVANAMTDGYGRRSLDLSADSVGGRGAGVQTGEVQRHVDRGILGERRLAGAERAGLAAKTGLHDRLEALIGRPGDAAALSSRIASLEESLIDAATDPSSEVRLSRVGDRLGDVVRTLNTASAGVQSLRAEADTAIARQVDDLNTALGQVERLNSDITRARNTGNDPSALMDQRQQVIDRIAEIVPIREMDRAAGQVALITPSGQVLIDGPAQRIGFVATPVITADMSLAGGGLQGLTLNGAPVASGGVGKLGGGTLGAAFHARDTVLVQAQADLDLFAADLVSRLSNPAIDPTLLPADPGVLTDAGAPLDPMDITGLSGRIALNAAIDPDQGGALWRLRDGINATTPGPAGQSALLTAISDRLAAPAAAAPGLAPHSAAGHAARLEARIGSARLDAQTEEGFAAARHSALRDAEAAGGVDIDHELQMLLRIEQSYAANARLIQTVDQMIRRLMEI